MNKFYNNFLNNGKNNIITAYKNIIVLKKL